MSPFFGTNDNFNSHAHVERDSLRNTARKGVQDFNSHAHVERDLPVPLYAERLLYFNSHAHVERDNILLSFLGLLEISTHTLTWSVTFLSLSITGLMSFQLTRSRGA